jgi:long-chain acyl-CoA synthetase
MSGDRLASDDPTDPPQPPSPSPSPTITSEYWVFDVDGCLVDSVTGSSLRPGAVAILEGLATAGRRIVLWSAGGDTYAQAKADEFHIDHFVNGCFAKEGRDADGYYRTTHLPVEGRRTVFVDDRPEDLAPGLDVLAVSPYLADDPFDRGLEAVARRAGLT